MQAISHGALLCLAPGTRSPDPQRPFEWNYRIIFRGNSGAHCVELSALERVWLVAGRCGVNDSGGAVAGEVNVTPSDPFYYILIKDSERLKKINKYFCFVGNGRPLNPNIIGNFNIQNR